MGLIRRLALLSLISSLIVGVLLPVSALATHTEGELVFDDNFDYSASSGGGYTSGSPSPPSTLTGAPTVDTITGLGSAARWRTHHPYEPAGQAWWNTSNANVILPGDGTLQLKLNYSSGEVAHAGRLTTEGLWSIAPPTADESVLVEARIKTPNTQGAWPTFWTTSAVSWPPEIDILEVFGEPTKASATYHRGVNDFSQLTKTGNWHDGFHSYAARWSTDKIEYFYDGVKVHEVTQLVGNDEAHWLIFSHQGLSESMQPWSVSAQQLVGSGSALETIDRVRVWRGGSGPPPDSFAASSVAGLQGWWKADAITGLGDGGAVSQWDDASGNGRNVAQATSGAKPSYETNELNGKPVVHFDGGDSLLDDSVGGLLRNASGGTVIVVARSQSSPTSLKGLASVATGDNTYNGRLGIAEGNVSGQHRITSRRLDADILDGRDGGTVTSGAFTIRAAVADFANGTRNVWVDGTNVISASGLATGNTSNTDSNRMVVGNLSNDAAGYQFLGDIAEVLVYDHALSTTERVTVENYLEAKYGMHGSFGASSVAGLQGWWKADAITGLGDGGAVSQWDDASGNGRNVAQATSGAKPSYETNELNGKPVVHFDGGDALFRDSVAGLLTGVSGATLIAVVKSQSSPTTAKATVFISTGDSTSNARAVLEEGRTSGQHGFNSRRLNADSLDIRAGGSVSTSWTVRTAAANFASGTRNLWVNATNVISASGLTTGSTNGTSAGRLGIGNFGNSGGGLLGDVAEVLVYDHALSTTERADVESYLIEKYGLG